MNQLGLFRNTKTATFAEGDVVYYESFFKDHDHFFQHCLKELPWKQGTIDVWGKKHKTPRLEVWIGDKPYSYSGQIMTPVKWTPLLLEIKEKIESETHHEFNSLLANLYKNGSHYVGYHSDDEKELGTNPIIASVSLGESRRFCFRRKDDPKIKGEILLKSGDLVIMKGRFQHDWQHTVPKTVKCKSSRINLTFRTIL